MNNQSRLQKIVAPIVLGMGLAMGVSTSAFSHPRHYDSYDNYDNSNYHQRSFIEVQPFRSLNVTPRYYESSPSYGSPYYDSNRHILRQRRVHRRGFRKPIQNRRYQNHRYDNNYYNNDYDGTYIRIRVR